jgi:hypothetical protein
MQPRLFGNMLLSKQILISKMENENKNDNNQGSSDCQQRANKTGKTN